MLGGSTNRDRVGLACEQVLDAAVLVCPVFIVATTQMIARATHQRYCFLVTFAVRSIPPKVPSPLNFRAAHSPCPVFQWL